MKALNDALKLGAKLANKTGIRAPVSSEDGAVARSYEPSHEYERGSLLKALGLGAAAFSALGIVYALINFYLPLVYIQFIVTAAFGLAGGFVVAHFIERFHIRSPKMATVITLAAAAVALYVHWAVWLKLFAVRAEVAVPFLAILFNPVNFFGFLAGVLEVGAWSFKNWVPKGFVLAAFWLVEAAMVLGLAALMGRAQSLVPYCESCKQWSEDLENNLKIAMDSKHALVELFQKGALAEGQEIKLAEDNAETYLTVEFRSCPKCDELIVGNIEQVTLETDKDGDLTESNEGVMHGSLIDRRIMDAVLAVA